MKPGRTGHLGQVDTRAWALGLHLRQRTDGPDPLAVDQDADVGLDLGRAAVR